MQDTHILDGFITELLHINEVADNKLIDLDANGGAGTYFLSHTSIDGAQYAVNVAAERMGKSANTVLLNSSLTDGEQRVIRQINTFDWAPAAGLKSAAALRSFVDGARKDLVLRGANTLFFSVGALKWRVPVKEKGKESLKKVTTPLLIYPVRLITTTSAAPVTVEFIDDDVYINPCLITKLAQVFGDEVADGFPLPAGVEEFSDPVDIRKLGDGVEYFKAVKSYVDGCRQGEDTEFCFESEIIAIAQYKHDELCTYHDIRANRQKIYSHPLVEKMFSASSTAERIKSSDPVIPACVLPRDSVQENIIQRALKGESLIVKGPPGTGKTVTIANMIAALLAENKKVIFASKKLSALGEVYAKLPEPLRKFTMLLDGETESAAAKISPEEIKQDFKKLLAEKKQYKEPATLYDDVRSASAARGEAMRALSGYIELMFNEKCIAEDSFYSALDAFCKVDMPVIGFADGEEIEKVTRAQYNALASRAEEAQRNFSVMCGGGDHPVFKCPWFNIDVDCDVEGAVDACVSIGADAQYTIGVVEEILTDCNMSADNFTLSEIAGVARCTFNSDVVSAVIDSGVDGAVSGELARRLADLKELENWDTPVELELPAGERLESWEMRLGALAVDGTLTKSEAGLIAANGGAFNMGDGSFADAKSIDLAAKIVGRIAKLKGDAAEIMKNFYGVFKSNLTDEERGKIESLIPALSGYFSAPAEKPKGLDFKGKKAFAQLAHFSFLSAPTFKECVAALSAYTEAKKLEEGIRSEEENLKRVFRRSLAAGEAECIALVTSKCQEGHEGYMRAVKDNAAFLEKLFAAAGGGATLSDVKNAVEKLYRMQRLGEVLEEFNQIAPVYGEEQKGREAQVSQMLLNLSAFLADCKLSGADGDDILKAALSLQSCGETLADRAEKIISALSEFGRKYFRNYFVINGEDNVLSDLKILIAEADDRDVIAAAATYSSIKSDEDNALDLASFLYWFEKGGALPEGVTFKDAFEHSFLGLAILHRDQKLGIMRNGLGNYEEGNLAKLEEAESKLNKLNALVIESKCLARIDGGDPDFIFVQDRNPGENLRLMFKRHAAAILKLKRCLILSPYTASLLFSQREYEDFDVLIMDEASQLEPALVLPVLFRSKQCVIVGDEWQMPPIKHFVSLAPAKDGGDGEGAIEPEISALGLALRCGGFPVEELICHYRSKTEALIKFSQEKFYPNMRTFPAPVPARKAAGGVPALGFCDVFVEDGVVVGGVNKREAEEVVKALNAHFDDYFDEESGVLSLPVGVVSFGQAQCDEIQRQVKADKKLDKKMQRALEKFGDLPEKLIFFKTIETVQGQETGHLILSITHGRRENGLNMNFGQLNQGKLGRCIFNVAVTRAQYMITVVHSVKSSEITGESVDYVREYLATVERFADDGRERFLSEKTPKGFITSVADFIKNSGLDEKRVVIGYGVTEGSVRIPIAILSNDLQRAVLGVWCERPVDNRYDFIDYNLKYKRSLAACGWNLHPVSLHDWIDNRQSEQQQLLKAIERIKEE